MSEGPTLEQRVMTLERRNRRFRSVGAAVLAVAVGFFVMGVIELLALFRMIQNGC